MGIEIDHPGRNVAIVRIDGVKAGWEQWVMVRGDAHHDSVYCNRKLEKQQLDLALEREALIIDCGDLFDAMQGKDDRRRGHDNMRPEYLVKDYYGAIVEDAAEFYTPYAKQWIIFGRGNHDQTVLDKVGVDLISNLTYRINTKAGAICRPGGYGGYVRFIFYSGKNWSYNLKYFHGSGGGGPVTKSMIQTNRQAVIYPSADIVVNGHYHESFVVSLARERLTNRGKIIKDSQMHVRTPGYKDGYGDGGEGWEVETGKPPKSNGCVWLRFFHDRQEVRVQGTPDIV